MAKAEKITEQKVGFSFHQLSVNMRKSKVKKWPYNHQLMETHLIMITIIKDGTKSYA